MMIYVKLFLVFAKIGLFGFGGGMAMLPMIYQGAETFGLMSSEEFSNLVAIAQVTPGPIAVNAATYVGYNCAGISGAIVATLGVALPSFILVLIVASFIQGFRENRFVDGAFAGIRPVTAGLIASAAVIMGQNAFTPGEWIPVAIFVLTIVAVSKFKVSPIAIIIVSAVCGALIYG